MIILDTNVVSELMRGSQANTNVTTWLRSLRQPPVTTVITRAEIMAGIALLPEGIRRRSLSTAVAQILDSVGVCLPLTAECADRYAEIVAERRLMGAPIGAMDALIAAVARQCEAAVATRDLRGFEGLGLDIIDPFSHQP